MRNPIRPSVHHGKDRNISNLEIIKDEGLSGFKANRPGFQRLQAMCRSGEINTVIVYDLSRLSRSVRDTLAFIEDVVQRHGVNFISLTQDVDTASPMGRAFLGFTSIFNQLYR
ncbi:MAG: recombinase family protein, partial [Proteobacteria bacterium]